MCRVGCEASTHSLWLSKSYTLLSDNVILPFFGDKLCVSNHVAFCLSCVYSVTMAAVDVSKAEAEIQQLKGEFGQDCQVICGAGDFSHIVAVSFKKWGVKVKFQIAGIIAVPC